MKLPTTPEANHYRKLRLSVGLSATELARGLGVTRETISRREAGKMKITMEAWLALSHICEETFKVIWSYTEAEKRHDETHDDATKIQVQPAPKPGEKPTPNTKPKEQIQEKEPMVFPIEGRHSAQRGERSAKPKRKKRR